MNKLLWSSEIRFLSLNSKKINGYNIYDIKHPMIQYNLIKHNATFFY